MLLSKNFTLAELTKSPTAAEFDIDNTPGPHELENLKALAVNTLQPIRNMLGRAVFTRSGFRSSLLNRRTLGASKTSQHEKGEAADIECPGVSTLDLAEMIVASGIPFDQLILEFHTPGIPDSGWVHVSYSRYRQRREIRTAVKRNGKTVYLPGLPIMSSM